MSPLVFDHASVGVGVGVVVGVDAVRRAVPGKVLLAHKGTHSNSGRERERERERERSQIVIAEQGSL